MVKEENKLELEIAGILLGLLFVVASILATVPDSLLELLKQTGISGLGAGRLSFADFVIPICFSSFFILLGSIIFYLLFNGTKIKLLLMFGRTFLAIGILFIILLSISFLAVVSIRLSSPISGSVPYMNPLFGYALIFSIIGAILSLFFLWLRYGLGKYREWKKFKK
jgi:hypothetical protein